MEFCFHSFFVIFVSLLLVSCGNTKKDTFLLIKNVTIIDSEHPVRNGMDVLIRENRIVEIATSIPNEESKVIFDGTGKYLIPGLWDAHVHLTFDTLLTSSMFDLFLANGVTSIRDTGGKMNLVKPLKDKASDHPKKFPRVKIAGPLLDGANRVYDGGAIGRPDISRGILDEDQAKAAVDDLAKQGVDLIKAYELLPPDLFKAVVSRAKYHGLKVTGHIPLSMTAIEAAESGLSSMEHMRNIEMSMSGDVDRLLAERRKMLENGRDTSGYALRSYMHKTQRARAVQSITVAQKEKVLQSLRENEVWQIPTYALNLSWELEPWNDREWHKTYKSLPKKVEQRWLKSGTSISKRSITEDRKVYLEWIKSMIPEFVKNDIPILAGTDTPIFFLTPGYSLHRELEVLVTYGGLTPIEALRTATYGPAQYFNLEKDLGTIQKGKIADLILLNRNPLVNIKHTSSITMVVKDGQYYTRSQLDEMLIN